MSLKQLEINAVITYLKRFKNGLVCRSRDEAQGPCRRFSYMDKMSNVMEATLFAIDRLYAVSNGGWRHPLCETVGMLQVAD